MSCQASRLITTNATTLSTPTKVTTPEDPYAFTETFTPPILFNTQKSRSRVPDSQFTVERTPINQKFPLAQLNGNILKTQASSLAIAYAATAASTATPTAHFKNVTQSQISQQKCIIANVCVVRPQQHQPQLQQHQKQRKQQQPPPLLLPHTPSLWHTPLLLESAQALAAVSTTAKSVPITPTTPAPTTIATAMVSPLVSPSNSTLPPSKFHSTTLAQHLHKVECIKKPKKAIANKQQQQHDADQKLMVSQTAPPPLQAFAASAPSSQHSDSSDLNEIPVNVIFRKPQTTNEITRTLLSAASGTGALAGDCAEVLHKKVAPATTSAAKKMKGVKIIAPTRKVNSPAVLPVRLQQEQQVAKAAATSQDIHVKPDNSRLSTIQMSSNAVAATCKAKCTAVPMLSKTTPVLFVKSENGLQTEALYALPPLHKVEKMACKRKPKRLCFPGGAPAQKKSRKSFPSLFSSDRPIPANFKCDRDNTAVAVVKLSAAEVDADTSVLASAAALPYCVQQHWLSVYETKALVRLSALTPNADREDCIAQHKSFLRRQALQLFTTRSLQKLPLHAARRRLLCVDRLLRKYHNHSENDSSAKKCAALICNNRALELASHCQQHIGGNASQHIFLPCTAKFADNTQCRIPVFDISHDMSLCAEHARKRDAYNRSACEQRPRKLSVAAPHLLCEKQPDNQSAGYGKNGKKTTPLTAARKRKLTGDSANPVGRPQKRPKKVAAAVNSSSVLFQSAVLQRKSSTTSLESIASNSYSCSSQTQQRQTEQTLTHQCITSNSLSPPALAPLSGSHATSRMLNFTASATVGADLKEHEINEIVTQLALVAASSNNINQHNNNNNICGSSSNSLSFANTNSNSNFTSSGLGSSSSLPSDELLTQDMLSICENSSVYASSEDTGLGGLSETELIAGAPDADEIPLADARLFFDDLANVVNAMPADAFNELFTTVHPNEREEVERALELADKHLKTLQQTIGSESDFLGDFLDSNDDMLRDTGDICSRMEIVSSVMHPPETSKLSNVDSSTLFMDNGSNSAGSADAASAGCASAVDIRGLVLT